VAERGGLENRCTRKRTVGSNPTPSANSLARTDAMAACAAIFLAGSKAFAEFEFTAETGRPWMFAPFCCLCLFPT
jgi:hypothetical protein